MKKILISIINLYQKIPGPWHNQCRYYPTCSNYAKEAINEYGALKGSFLAIKRILRCNPLQKSGYDPVPKKESYMKKTKKITFLLILILILFTGCSNDDMENIDIIVTNYPNEYITKMLYDDHAMISSIYPDGVAIDDYKISKKQKNDFANKDLFIYNGLIEKERNLALDLLEINPNLKIIDTAYVLETDYSPEELWLNPSSLLMMAQNIRLGLEEYITNNYLKKEIDKSYDELKLSLSELDANYRVDVENTSNKTVIVNTPALKYLEKFGIEVICIDDDATEKTISDAEKLIKAKTISYIFTFKGEEPTEKAKSLLSAYPEIKTLQLHKLDNISDEERNEKKNYLTIMNENLELLKQELYQ